MKNWNLLFGLLSVGAVGSCAPGVTDLTSGPAIERKLGGGQQHSYRLRLGPGQYARVVVEQKGIDVVVELISPRGQVLTTVDSPNGREGPESVSEVASQGGSYNVDVTSLSATAAPGLYQIRVMGPHPATEEERQTVAGERSFAAAEIFRKRGDRNSLSEAVAEYERAVRIWRQLRDEPHLATSLHKMGLAHTRRGGWRKAREAYQESLNLFRELGDTYWQAELENRLGWVEERTGNLLSALGHYRRAENLFRALGHKGGLAAALNNLGAVLASQGDFQDALGAYREALATCRDLGKDRLEAHIRVNLGSLMLRLDRLDLAQSDLMEALATYRALSDSRRIAVTLRWLAEVAHQDDRFTEALDFIEESLELRRRTGAPRDHVVALNTLGNIHRSRGETAAALKTFHEALEILRAHGPSPEEVWTLLDLALLHADSGRNEAALDLYGQALERFQSTENQQGEAASRKGIARALRDSGHFAEALDQIAMAVDLVDEIRSESASRSLSRAYRDFRQGYYELEVDVLMHLAEAASPTYEAAAFEAVERSRARALLEALTVASTVAEPADSPELSGRRAELRRQLENLVSSEKSSSENEFDGHAIGRLLVQLEELETRQAGGDPVRFRDSEVVGLDEIRQNLLDDGTLLLVFALGERRSFLWAVSRGGLSSHVLPKASEIEPLAELAHRALQRASREEQQEAHRSIRRLSEILLAPVADRLGENRLLVVADGALNLLPFAVLPDPRFDDDEASPRRLVETHEIVSLPSLSVLSALRRQVARRSATPGLLAVIADPVFGTEDPRLGPSGPTNPVQTASLSGNDLTRSARDLGLEELERLPNSGEEATAILRLARGAAVWQALGLAAHREKILSGDLTQYRILHFATHGLLHPKYPELSGLVLSLVDENGQSRNGFLRAYEVAGLDLPAEMVVLSACRTGLGQRVRGEGLVGLSHSFMNAGALRVVMSLWNVGDRSTAELMKRFYRQIFDRGRAPAAALREAQLSMLREDEWTLPKYWAGFVFQGDWRRFTLDTNEGSTHDGQ